MGDLHSWPGRRNRPRARRANVTIQDPTGVTLSDLTTPAGNFIFVTVGPSRSEDNVLECSSSSVNFKLSESYDGPHDGPTWAWPQGEPGAPSIWQG